MIGLKGMFQILCVTKFWTLSVSWKCLFFHPKYQAYPKNPNLLFFLNLFFLFHLFYMFIYFRVKKNINSKKEIQNTIHIQLLVEKKTQHLIRCSGLYGTWLSPSKKMQNNAKKNLSAPKNALIDNVDTSLEQYRRVL